MLATLASRRRPPPIEDESRWRHRSFESISNAPDDSSDWRVYESPMTQAGYRQQPDFADRSQSVPSPSRGGLSRARMCVRCQGSIIISLEQQLSLQRKASEVEVAAKLHEELAESQSQVVELREEMEAVRKQLLASQAEVAQAQARVLDGRGQLVQTEAEVARLESGFDALALRLSEASTQLAKERQLRLEHEAAWPAAAREQMAAELEAARAEATSARAEAEAARAEAAAAREEAAATRGQMQVMAEVELKISNKKSCDSS